MISRHLYTNLYHLIIPGQHATFSYKRDYLIRLLGRYVRRFGGQVFKGTLCIPWTWTD